MISLNKIHEEDFTFDEIELENEEYHSLKEYLSSSMVKKIYDKGFWNFAVTKDEVISGDALDFGSAFHCYVLEKSKFPDLIAVQKKVDGRTKAGKEYKELFAKQSEGKIVIDESDYETIKNMAKALDEWLEVNPDIAQIYNESRNEVSFLGEAHGMKMKIRFDKIHSSGVGFDLKTCQDASKFSKDSYKFNYDIQDIHYRMIALDFIFIAVEKTYPYNVMAYKHSPQRLEKAYSKWLDTISLYDNYKDEPVVLRPQGILEI